MTVGVVRSWYGEEGWGVIDSAETPGGCWVHFSHLWAGAMPKAAPGQSLAVRTSGTRQLRVGETVDFDWEAVTQDGFAFRATDVRPDGEPPRWEIVESTGGYASFVDINFDESQ
ncbi:cold-shock protein [Antrihabitans cavernicola]|uniref:Cold shock domain-containing protein n=1 Tax=Antrihabitans cavernicola TaxID=2495913 RepID=A0A5A7S3A2_9NOCA|nr:hypothetical protein [Spelaeibacter cavernicola]KAA0018978.1 hypothetical protein FOY51_23370 [Spelaeibacter cavernicola]